MSTFLLKNPDCVFIHIPKAVGSSIGKGVWTKAIGPRLGRGRGLHRDRAAASAQAGLRRG